MSSTPRMKVAGTVFSTPDAHVLAGFYERFLGWPRLMDEGGWVVLREEGGDAGALSFHEDEASVRPTWPSRADAQQVMMHLDIGTDDLDAAVSRAIECGADVADHQPQPDVRVMLDPDGHPFCLFRAQFDA